MYRYPDDMTFNGTGPFHTLHSAICHQRISKHPNIRDLQAHIHTYIYIGGGRLILF